jgi:hypothetical protein
MKRLALVGVAFAVIYLAGLAFLFAVQRSLIYPAPDRPWPDAPGYTTVSYPTADGLTLRAL